MLLIDFETYYDSEYSLTKMPTWQYLRDPRFECLGAAVYRTGEDRAQYLRGDALREYLTSHTDDVAVAHNAAFDASVGWHWAGWRPKKWLCTQNMARYAIAQGHLPPELGTSLKALGAHYGMVKGDTAEAVEAGGQALEEYAIQDLRILARLLAAFLPLTPDMEKALINLHVEMASYPVLDLDTDILTELAAKDDIPEDLAKACRSRATFQKLLEGRGVTVEMKTSPRTGKPSPAFAKSDTFMRNLQEHKDPVVRRLAEVRLQVASTIKQSRAQRFLDTGAPMPVPLRYYGAHTGRASGLDRYNMQNLPSRGDAGRLRHALKAPPGHKLVIVDSSQIEVRVLAWLAGEEALLEVFRQGGDPYRAFGARRYNTTPEQVSPDQRKVAKAAVLALGFGQGGVGFLRYCEQNGVPVTDPREAESIVRDYRQAYPAIPRFWRECMDEVTRTGKQVLPSGRILTYPDMQNWGRDVGFYRHKIFSKTAGRDKVKLWPGLATENRVQAVARDVVMWQTLEIAKRYRVVLSCHDEVVLCVPEDQAESALAFAMAHFERPPWPWAKGLPVSGEGQISDHYTK